MGGQSLVTGTTTVDGDIATSFAIPAFIPGGTYNIIITTSAGDTSKPQTFRVVPRLTLSTFSGNVGDRITITGMGFTANTTVTIYMDSLSRLTTTTNSLGIISVSYTIPGCIQGSHVISVVDSATGEKTTNTFTTFPKVTVSPALAAAGEPLTVTGTGFGERSAVSIHFDNIAITNTLSDVEGGFTFGFPLPVSASGDHEIRVEDSSGNEQSTTVSVVPGISIVPVTGTVGTPVTVSGNGFKANQTVNLSFNGLNLTDEKSLTNAVGHFSTTLNIPPVPSGPHKLAVSDGVNNDSRDFVVTSNAVVSPVSGFIGTKITLNGTGFMADHPVTIIFNNVPADTVDSSAQGSFTSTFEVPTYPAGLYKIKATDGINTSDADFTVSSSVSITDTSATMPGYVGAPVVISGIKFKAGATVVVTYDAKQVTTGEVDNNGSFSVTFFAPVSKSGEHTITVTDGVMVLPLTYFMDPMPPFAPTLLKPDIGVRQQTQGTFTWKPVADPSGVTYVLQIADNTDFSKESILLEKKGLTTSEYTLTKTERLKATAKEIPYYWRVRAIDGASNESDWSNGWSFTVGGVIPTWALWTVIILGVLSIFLFAFWFGRRTSTKTTSAQTKKE